MTQIGFHASHEQFPPSQLLGCLKRAEAAGFHTAMCSDHFHPWGDRQGQSGFAWSWLGAALEATNLALGTVCAPGQRYHPAIIAQAAATLDEMYPGRFWIALGSGENLNEHITGDPWPSRPERDARLKECADIMRALWAGETVTRSGIVRIDRAKLYTLPSQPPKLIGAAITPEAAAWMGSWTDGLITCGTDTEGLRKTLDAYRSSGGDGKPIYLQAALSYAPTEDEAIEAACDQWGHCVLPGKDFADLATPAEFDAKSAGASPDEVRRQLHVSADLSEHIAWLRQAIALGFDTIFLHHVGRNLDRFIDVFGQSVLPQLQ